MLSWLLRIEKQKKRKLMNLFKIVSNDNWHSNTSIAFSAHQASELAAISVQAICAPDVTFYFCVRVKMLMQHLEEEYILTVCVSFHT